MARTAVTTRGAGTGCLLATSCPAHEDEKHCRIIVAAVANQKTRLF
jgi:hypothetical protein